jgi:hypothetical protein
MRADRHHAATVGSFYVEDVKIILQILQIAAFVVAGESTRTMSLLRIV